MNMRGMTYAVPLRFRMRDAMDYYEPTCSYCDWLSDMRIMHCAFLLIVVSAEIQSNPCWHLAVPLRAMLQC